MLSLGQPRDFLDIRNTRSTSTCCISHIISPTVHSNDSQGTSTPLLLVPKVKVMKLAALSNEATRDPDFADVEGVQFRGKGNCRGTTSLLYNSQESGERFRAPGAEVAGKVPECDGVCDPLPAITPLAASGQQRGGLAICL